MKKALSLFFAIVMVIAALPFNTYAEEPEIENEWTYITVNGKDPWEILEGIGIIKHGPANL